MSDVTPECILDECCFMDSETREYGYAVACTADHGCGYWRLLFMVKDAVK